MIPLIISSLQLYQFISRSNLREKKKKKREIGNIMKNSIDLLNVYMYVLTFHFTYPIVDI